MFARWVVWVLLLLLGPPSAWAQGQLINGNRVITGTLNAATTTGSANAYILTLNPAISAYTSNQCFTFRANFTNTGAATLNVNGVGAAPLKVWLATVSSDLRPGDVTSGQIILACYDGTNMQIVGSGASAAAPEAGHYWTSQAEAGLSAETNLGALASGILKHSVSAGVSTPAVAVAGTDYAAPLGFTPENTANKSTAALGTSTTLFPTQSAVKTYVDAQVATKGDAFTNTSTSVDGEMALFSGTAGKTVRRASMTGLLKATAGIPTAATAGVDYMAPLGFTAVPDTRALTITGTANEITLSTGSQSLAADRTWAVSLATALNLAGHTMVLPSSTTLPATCGSGQIYFDTDATPGQNLYGCTSSNTWTLLSGGGTATGDVTAVGSCTTGDCFTSGTPSQRFWFAAMAAPATPAAGVGTVYVDATGKNLCVLDDAGLVKCGVQAKAAVTSQWLRSIGIDGTVAASQPAFTDISGSVTNAQLPSTISGKRWTPGAVALTDAATVTLNADTTEVGYLLTLSQDTTFAVPAGTAVPGQLMRVWILSSAVRALTWASGSGGFSANMGLPLPTFTTGGGNYDMFGFQWNQNSSRWDMVSTTQSSLSSRRRTCVIRVGADSESSPLANAQLGPELHACMVPTAAVVEEVTVQADAGTPNVIVHRRTGTTNTALLSSALATAAAGATACARVGGGGGFTPAVTCSSTLQNTTVAGGDSFGLTSGTAGGTAKRMTITITYLLSS